MAQTNENNLSREVAAVLLYGEPSTESHFGFGLTPNKHCTGATPERLISAIVDFMFFSKIPQQKETFSRDCRHGGMQAMELQECVWISLNNCSPGWYSRLRV